MKVRIEAARSPLRTTLAGCGFRRDGSDVREGLVTTRSSTRDGDFVLEALERAMAEAAKIR
jgi:hypothetical protein